MNWLRDSMICFIVVAIIIIFWLSGCTPIQVKKSEPTYKANCVDRALCAAIIARRNDYLTRIEISEGLKPDDGINHCQTQSFRKGKWRWMDWREETTRDHWSNEHIEYITLEEGIKKWVGKEQ